MSKAVLIVGLLLLLFITAAVLVRLLRTRRGGKATHLGSVRQAQAELATVIASTPDAIVRFDRGLRVLLVNAAAEQISGLPQSEWLGRPLRDCLEWRDTPPTPEQTEASIRWVAEVEACFRSGRSRQFEVRAIDDGAGEPARDLEVRLVPETDGSSVATVLALARDITDRRRVAEVESLLRAQLDQAERLSGLGHLAAGVAHEFNNVLMGISPFAELIRRQNPDNPTLQTATTHIAESIARGRRITQEVLRYAKPVDPVLAALPLRDWLAALYRSAIPALGDIALDGALPEEPLFVTADAGQLEQVLMNLILNASHATEGTHRISVTVRRPSPDEGFSFGHVPHVERYIQFTVADDGAGLAPHDLARVFEPLYKTTKKSRHGTGLALAVAHQIVARHGGYIFAASPLGGGTHFHVFLPAANRTDSRAERHVEPAHGIGVRGVLLIEDDAPVAAGIAAMLEELEVETQIALTASDGLLMLRRSRPDAVVLDISLPDMDGKELFLRMREIHPELPVIISTGHADPSGLGPIMQQPFVAHLMKPYDTAALIRAFQAVGLGSNSPDR